MFQASERLHDKMTNFVSKNKAAQLQQRLVLVNIVHRISLLCLFSALQNKTINCRIFVVWTCHIVLLSPLSYGNLNVISLRSNAPYDREPEFPWGIMLNICVIYIYIQIYMYAYILHRKLLHLYPVIKWRKYCNWVTCLRRSIVHIVGQLFSCAVVLINLGNLHKYDDVIEQYSMAFGYFWLNNSA